MKINDSIENRKNKDSELKQAYNLARKYLEDPSSENLMELEDFAENNGISLDFGNHRIFLENDAFSAIAFSDDIVDHLFDFI